MMKSARYAGAINPNGYENPETRRRIAAIIPNRKERIDNIMFVIRYRSMKYTVIGAFKSMCYCDFFVLELHYISHFQRNKIVFSLQPFILLGSEFLTIYFLHKLVTVQNPHDWWSF
jgi:hypothetical protein